MSATTIGDLRWDFTAPDAVPGRVREAFSLYGFAVIRGVLDTLELCRVRSELDRVFASPHLRPLPLMITSELLKHELVWRCLFKEQVVGPLRAALGPELCYQNDLDVQRNSYGQRSLQRRPGWHMDAGSEGHNAYLRSTDYRFAKCGIFLQNYDNGWGGGIMVKPKSHRRYSEPGSLKRKLFSLRRALDRVAIRAGAEFDTLTIPTRAGDLCFFDSRLLHSSVLPDAANIRKIGYHRKRDIGLFWPEIPREHTKYVIYWDACNSAMSEDFLRNSIKRSETEPSEEGVGRMAQFTRTLAVRYPDDYPVNFVAAARSNDVTIASLSKEDAAFYKHKMQSMLLLHA